MNEKLNDIDLCSLIEKSLTISSREIQINELEAIHKKFLAGFLDKRQIVWVLV